MSSCIRWIVLALASCSLSCASNDAKDAMYGTGAAGRRDEAAAGSSMGGAFAASSGGSDGNVTAGTSSAGRSAGDAVAGDAGGHAAHTGGAAGERGDPNTGGATDSSPERGGTSSAGESGRAGSSGGSSGTPATSGTPTLFWLDVSGKVLSSDATNFAVKTVVPSAGQGSDGIAVDVAAGYIYWTDMGAPTDDDGSVMRSNLDGSKVTTIVPKGGTYTPKQLKLVPEQGKLYWSDREGMRVMRSNVDGSAVETIYQSGSTDADRQDDSRWCVGIAVDVAGGYFYWSQKGTDSGHEGSVRRAHLTLPDGDAPDNRSDVEVLFEGEAATCDIDLDLDAGFVYWANRGDDTINRGPLALPDGVTPKTRTDKQVVVRKVDQAIGVFLDHPRGLVYYTDAVGDVGRASLDGTGSQFLLTKGGAFTGIVVVDLTK